MSTSTYTPPPSKSALDHAGDVLRNENSVDSDRKVALEVLSNWRKSHSYALNTFQAMLRGRCKSQGFHESDYFVAQRLKRVPSIVMKLRRLRTRLSQMQDIAGLRVVLPSVKDVREFHEALVNSNAKHEARLPAKDYILAPKKDGYRSIHQIFKYRNAKHADLNVLSVEVQIRTRLQHAWATAVETLGAIEHSSFKTGEGTDEVKQFFKLSSALMSHHEGTPVLDELANIDIKQVAEEFIALERKLNIFKKLATVSIATKNVIGYSDGHYSLMFLNMETEQLSITPFDEAQASLAEDIYLSMENRYRDDPSKLVVLVSVGDLKSLRIAYPNYFLDTHLFISTLKKICTQIK